MLRLLAFAVRVELFGQLADVRLLCFRDTRKWEFIEASAVVISCIIANPEPATSRSSPYGMYGAT
jgi:hypothetical protein